MRKLLLIISICLFANFIFAQNTGIIPTPQKVESRDGNFVWDDNVVFYLSTANMDNTQIVYSLKDAVFERFNKNIKVVNDLKKLKKGTKIIKFNIVESLPIEKFADQGYTIEIATNEIVVEAIASQGLFYGTQSLKQLLRFNWLSQSQNSSVSIPCMKITDYPALEYRGWMDDISRGPIVTVDYVKKMIETLAEYKFNFFNLYTEHVFKLESHPDIAPQDGLTAHDIKELEKFAKPYFIEFIGNQQCFAHAEKTLQIPFYDDITDTKYNLNPGTEKTYDFLEDVFSEVAPAYSSTLFNINCDETEGLGSGKAHDYVEKTGATKAYYKHINRVNEILKKYGKRVMMWGDIAVKHPEIIENLPQDMMIISWSYVVADDFNGIIIPFKESGFEFMIAPGVSMWSTVFPSVETYKINISNFVRDGYKHGARGMMNTAWDDSGESLLNSAVHGLIWGAEMSWKPIENTDAKLAEQERDDRFASFNKNFNVQYFSTFDDAIDAILQLDALSKLLIGNLMSFGALHESLLDFYPSKIDDKSRDDNTFIYDETQKVLHILSQKKEIVKENSEIFDNAIYSAKRIAWCAKRNLLRIQLYKTYQDANYENVAASKKQIGELFESLRELKNEYIKLWERENRAYWRDINLKKYDKIAQELLDAGTHIFIESALSDKGEQIVQLHTIFGDREIYYTVDGSDVKKNSKIYKEPIVIKNSCVVKARCFDDYEKGSTNEIFFLYHKGIGHLKKLNCKYSTYRPEYSAGGDNGLLDGIVGTNSYVDGRWQGYQGQDVDIEIDFKKVEKVQTVKMRFLQNSYDWILSPNNILIYSSKNGADYQLVTTKSTNVNHQQSGTIVYDILIDNINIETRYLRIVAENPGLLPDWHPSPNQESYLFVDEIIIE